MVLHWTGIWLPAVYLVHVHTFCKPYNTCCTKLVNYKITIEHYMSTAILALSLAKFHGAHEAKLIPYTHYAAWKAKLHTSINMCYSCLQAAKAHNNELIIFLILCSQKIHILCHEATFYEAFSPYHGQYYASIMTIYC